MLPHILLSIKEKEITQALDGSVVPLALQARGPEFDPQNPVIAGHSGKCLVSQQWGSRDGEIPGAQ